MPGESIESPPQAQSFIDVLIVTTSTTTQPQNGDEDEDSNVLLGHVAHQDYDAV